VRHDRQFRTRLKDRAERAAQKICIACKQSYKLENRKILAPDGSRKVYPCHQHPDGRWHPCGASDTNSGDDGCYVPRNLHEISPAVQV